LEQGIHGRRYKVISVVYVNGANQAQRDALVHTDMINRCVVSNRLGGFKRRISKHIGVTLMLQVVLMRFIMIDSVSSLLVGNSK
jgi:hypothetical protein